MINKKKNSTNKQSSIIIKDTELISVLQSLPIGIIIYSLKNILFANTAAFEILKFDKKLEKKLYNHSIFDFLLPEFHKTVKGNAIKLFNGKAPIKKIYKLHNIKNQIFDIEVKSNVIFFNGEKAIQAVFTDVSEGIKIKNELTESKEKLDLITENSNDLIFFYSAFPKSQYNYLSDASRSMLGYDPSFFYKDPNFGYNLVVNKEEYKKNEKKLYQLQKSNSKQEIKSVFQYKTKSGNLVWLEDRYTPIFDEHNKIKYFLGLSRDVTIEKEAQIELEIKHNSYQNLVDSAPVGIFIHQKGICLFANSEACKILEEKSINHIIGKYLIDYIIPEQRVFGLDRIKRALTGEVLDYKTYLIKTAKKREVEVELKTTNVFFNGANCVQTTMTNVSYEKKLQAQTLKTELAEQSNKKLINVIKDRDDKQAKLNTIFNTSTHIIWTVDKNFKLSSFNQNYYIQIFDFYNKILEIGIDYKKLYKSISNKSDYIYWISKFESAFKGENIVFETKKLLDNGDYIYREIFLNPTIDENGNVSEIVAISHNITERKINEIKAQEKSAKLSAIFESSAHLIWTVDNEFNLTECNSNFIKTFRDNHNVIPIFKKPIHIVLPKDKQQTYKSYWYDLYSKVLKGNSLKFERTQFSLKGEFTIKEIYLNPIRNANNEIIEIACLAHDITENKIFEKQILEQSAKLKAIFESGDQLMWTITKDKVIRSFNQNYSNSVFDLYGYYPEIGKTMRSEKTTKYHPYWDDKYEQAFNGRKVEFISERKTLKGETIIRQMILNPIKDAFNNVIEVSGIGFDITENKKNEEKVSQSLKEKEILLKEVHHRVKNNMQVISSILNLQSSYVKDEYALSLLKECQNRIKSMAYIHESLYQTKNFEGVNFSEYISTLSKNLVHTYSVNTKNVKLVLNLADLFLNLDLSIPCGLIINEIISNSLKYAFPSKKGGIIFVNLTVKNKSVNIEIGDNGIGIPSHIDIKQTQTLGLQLVDTLIEQIDGSLKLERTNGTKFIIKFKN